MWRSLAPTCWCQTRLNTGLGKKEKQSGNSAASFFHEARAGGSPRFSGTPSTPMELLSDGFASCASCWRGEKPPLGADAPQELQLAKSPSDSSLEASPTKGPAGDRAMIHACTLSRQHSKTPDPYAWSESD